MKATGKSLKGKVQQQWGKLTNDDLDVIEGKRTELAGRLQQRYGIAKGDAERESMLGSTASTNAGKSRCSLAA